MKLKNTLKLFVRRFSCCHPQNFTDYKFKYVTNQSLCSHMCYMTAFRKTNHQMMTIQFYLKKK